MTTAIPIRALCVAAALALAGCAASRETLLSGETMGSAWTVKIAGRLPAPAATLQAGAQAAFERVDQALSTYRPTSALSRFNDGADDAWQDIDPELAEVMSYALSLGERSDGAYDVTVGPLVNLWGFGPDPAVRAAPGSSAIDAARARVGWHNVRVDVAAHRARKPASVRVDLSSLGKGRGVDRVADFLDSHGVTNYLIDLSGKLRARGRNARGEPWRIAVEKPGPDDSSGAPVVVPEIVELDGTSIATAGDYRRYFESGGRHYSHIIDPRTGYPVTHSTLSATAIARDCMTADALATVFMAMLPERALALAAETQTPALLIRRGAEHVLLTPSAGWPGRGPATPVAR